MRAETAALHGGHVPRRDDPLLAGPVFASGFQLSGDDVSSGLGYARFDNPTWSALEESLGALEGGDVVVFSSGMAAITAVFCALLAPGDTVVLPSDGYFATRTFAATYLERWGVRVKELPTVDGAQAEGLEGAAMLWLETPTNPHLDVCDVAALSDAAHVAGAIVVVDNTTASPLLQRPLELGADLSVSSGTKVLSGHSDVLLGHAACTDPTVASALRQWRTLSGSIVGPMEAWLAHRGLLTVGARLDFQQRNAQAVAELLRDDELVVSVRYPGLPTDRAHALACRQMSGFGSLVGVTLPDGETANRFLAASELLIEATSFGGVHSTAERRGRWGTDDVPDGFVRISVGCEHVDDLSEDIGQALRRADGSG